MVVFYQIIILNISVFISTNIYGKTILTENEKPRNFQILADKKLQG